MKFKKDNRFYTFLDKDDNVQEYRVNYTLFFNDNVLVDVRNEYHHSVEPKSECFDYFKLKYSK